MEPQLRLTELQLSLIEPQSNLTEAQLNLMKPQFNPREPQLNRTEPQRSPTEVQFDLTKMHFRLRAERFDLRKVKCEDMGPQFESLSGTKRHGRATRFRTALRRETSGPPKRTWSQWSWHSGGPRQRRAYLRARSYSPSSTF